MTSDVHRVRRATLGVWVLIAAVTVMGVTALATQIPRWQFKEQRPFVQDPTLSFIGPRPHGASYPSGHASSAAVAAEVMGHFRPERAAEFERLADEVAAARVYSGVHVPSDVQIGAALGHRIGAALT